MSEVTRYGGGTVKSDNEVAPDDGSAMRIDMNEADSAYQLAWIKNLNNRTTTLENP